MIFCKKEKYMIGFIGNLFSIYWFMRKILSYSVIAILAMHITVSFWNAEENIDLNSAPIEQVAPISDGNGGTYSTWELMHRTFMLDGFTWTGVVAEYITPHMWTGISDILSIDNGAIYPLEPTNYTECVQFEMNASFGSDGSMIESTPTAELKNLAKYCATEFYGDYFSGKKYTTREEMTMFLLTALGENVSLEGEFVDGAFVTNGTETETPFNNVVKTAWYAPFLARGTEVDLLASTPPRWNTAREVSDTDIMSMLQGYFGTDESDINNLVKALISTNWVLLNAPTPIESTNTGVITQ